MSFSNNYEESLCKIKRKSQGSFYTPKEITDFAIKRCLELLPNPLSVLDPACGTGNFLLSANEALQDQGKLYGVDLDENAVNICRAQLPYANIKHGNSIVHFKFNWEEQFKDVMHSGGFDIILGNPPYIKHGKYKEIREYLKKHYLSYDGLADLYVYFIENSIKLLNENGILFFLVSNKWLLSRYGKGIRRYILENAKIVEIYKRLNGKIFKGVGVDTMIIILQKTKATDYEVAIYESL